LVAAVRRGAARRVIRFAERPVDRFAARADFVRRDALIFFEPFLLLADLRDFAEVPAFFRRFLAMRAPSSKWRCILSDNLIARVLILRLVLSLILCILAARPVHADQGNRTETSPEPRFERNTVEMSVIGGTSLPTSIFQAEADRRLTMVSFAVGRVLTGSRKGNNLQLLVDVAPLLQVRQPEVVWGWSVAPLFVRWNFPLIGRTARIFAEVSGSLLFTREPVPIRTTTFNFIDQAGFGVRVHHGDSHAWLVGYRFQHVSNAGRVKPNPGANFNYLYLGFSFLH
jgi:hypothetical protein